MTAPPSPKYNMSDNDDCKTEIELYYKKALISFEAYSSGQKIITASYQTILDYQTTKSFDLVNNAAFRTWTISDWTDSYNYKQDNSAVAPNWNSKVESVLGASAEKLRTTN